jgi:hypothetical protein
MKDDGYTLVEALAALFMIGLAIGGLIEGVHVLGRLQAAATGSVRDGRNLRQANQGLARLLARGGPFLSDGKTLTGDASEMNFPCGQGPECSARLVESGGALEVLEDGAVVGRYRLAGATGAQFVYGGATAEGAIWPPSGATLAGRQALRSVAIVEPTRTGAEPLAYVRLWSEQAQDCQFDVISQDCRETAP